jgi:hypothetical protein
MLDDIRRARARRPAYAVSFSSRQNALRTSSTALRASGVILDAQVRFRLKI